MSDLPEQERSDVLVLPATTGNSWSWEKKMEVVSRYMLLGNMRIVSEQTGVNINSLYEWKKQPWWADLVDQLKRQKKSKTNDSLTKIIEASLDVIQDRLENGDWVLNNKTGQVIRKPVSVKDANTIAAQLLTKQLQIEEFIEKNDSEKSTVQETLKLLATEFQKWSSKPKAPMVDVVDVESKEL